MICVKFKIVVFINNDFEGINGIESWIKHNKSENLLVIGNRYKVIREDSTSYLIDGVGWYYKWRFITIEEFRDMKINLLDVC